jgi:hypothetical protein
MLPITKLQDGADKALAGVKARMKPFQTVLVAVAVAAVGCTVWYGLFSYREKVAARNSYCIRPADLRLVQTTSWMTPEIAEEIHGTLNALPPRLSVMDDDAAGRVAACLEKSPWVRKVHEVRFNAPRAGDQTGGVDVSLSLRRPVAFVQVGEGAVARYVAVDREGLRVGRDPASEPLLGDRVLLVITGVRSEPPGQGAVWSDPAVLAGADVAAVFQSDAGHDDAVRFKLARIDVSNLGGLRDRKQPEIVIYTKDNGPRILWGGPRNKRTETLEGTPEEKVLCLRKLFLTEGGFEGHFDQIDLVERQVRRLPTDTHHKASLRS